MTNSHVRPRPTNAISIEFEIRPKFAMPRFKCILPITTKFCTSLDSVTVVTCAKFICDRFSIFGTRALQILNSIEITLMARGTEPSTPSSNINILYLCHCHQLHLRHLRHPHPRVLREISENSGRSMGLPMFQNNNLADITGENNDLHFLWGHLIHLWVFVHILWVLVF